MVENVTFSPTKKLFIDVLTRDISISECILDLLDNCVDSYTRNHIHETREVKLSFTPESFLITDSCGGIPKTDFLNEVFRFGATSYSDNVSTIGVWGIGLKRSIFKLGKIIDFETDDGTDYCKLHIDVEDWLKKENDWNLALSDTHSSNLNGVKPCTKICITKLGEEATDLFRTTLFTDNIQKTISYYYSRFINDNRIRFKVNNETIEGYEIKIISSNDYKPVKFNDKFDTVEMQIICWLHFQDAKGKVSPGGWNIYMNERLILRDDISKDTGWIGEKPYLPKYHPIYTQFRGIVFLTTNEPYKLPMNTSKTGLNTDSKVYHYMLSKMCEVSRPFINFLATKYDKPKEDMDDSEEEISTIASEDSNTQENPTKETNLSDTPFVATFIEPTVRKAIKSDTSIQYLKPKARVAKVRKILNVKSNVEVGSETFEYFWKSEGLNDYK